MVKLEILYQRRYLGEDLDLRTDSHHTVFFALSLSLSLFSS